VPTEWKAALKAELERDPPILGKTTLGGTGQSNIPLEALASGGTIGKSNIGIAPGANLNAISIGGVTLQRWADTSQLAISASRIFLGPSQQVSLGLTGSASLALYSNILYFGTNLDVAFVRNSAEQIDTYQRLALQKSVTATETPLVVNCGGAMYGVKVGGAGSGPGGTGRALWID
jgi:hypothetical protein